MTQSRRPHRASPALAASENRAERERALAQAMLELLKSKRDPRSRKLRRIRAAVRVRSYENALKLNIAIDRLAEKVLGAEC